MPVGKPVFISASRVPSITANSIQLMKVCQSFAQLGYPVHLLVPGDHPAPWGELADLYGLVEEFEIEWIPSRASLHRYDFACVAVRRARALHADAVYAWPLQAAVMALLWHIPVLLEMHGPPEGRFGPGLFWLFYRLSGVKRLLPITRALEDILFRKYRISPPAISTVVLPNGVDLERYQAITDPVTARKMLGLPERPTLGYSGHLYSGRGISLLVELARLFPQANHLFIGGQTGDLERWEKRLHAERIENVILTGFIENRRISQYQAAADILLMPYERSIQGSSGGNSVDYCSPMKMFEYMACGRAILSSDLPVLREVLNEKNAVFCPPEDVAAWSEALAALLADPLRRQTLAEQARADAQAYAWKSRAQRSLEGFL